MSKLPVPFVESSSHRRIVTISDSYGAHPSVDKAWPAKLNSLVSGIDYQYDIQKNGIGYYRQSDGDNALSLYTSKKSNIVDINTITDVIICLGLNDAAETYSNVRNASYNLFVQLHADMPNAKIWVGYPELGTHLADNYLSNITVIINSVAGIAGRLDYCRWMAGLEYIMHDTHFQESDGAHPNETGSNEIAKAIGCFINGGTYKYSYSATGTADWGNSSTSVCRFMIDGGITRIQIESGMVSGTWTFVSNTWLQVATLSTCRIANRSGCAASADVRYRANSSTDVYPIMFKTEGTKVYAKTMRNLTIDQPWTSEITLIMPTLES